MRCKFKINFPVLVFSLFFILLLSVQSVSAWSNQTYIHVCDEAVKYVWGSEVLEGCIYNQTLSFQKNFCDTIMLYLGERAYHLCMAEENVVHPALMPILFFNDQEYHRDYSSCPIRSDTEARYLCSMEKSNPALERSLTWFDISEDAPDVCTRVYEFCIASNYMADIYNPLNHILYGVDKGTCSEILDNKVENRIMELFPAGWSVAQVCSFKYTEEKVGQVVTGRYAQEFIVSNKTFVDLIRNLTFYANAVSQLPYRTTTTTVVTTSPLVTAESPMTSTIRAVTTTMPFIPTTPSTTPAEEAGGIGFFSILLLLLVLIVIGFFAFNQLSVEKGSKLMSGKHKFDRSPRKHQIKSLRSEEHPFEDIIAGDRVHSRLGSVLKEEEREG